MNKKNYLIIMLQGIFMYITVQALQLTPEVNANEGDYFMQDYNTLSWTLGEPIGFNTPQPHI